METSTTISKVFITSKSYFEDNGCCQSWQIEDETFLKSLEDKGLLQVAESCFYYCKTPINLEKGFKKQSITLKNLKEVFKDFPNIEFNKEFQDYLN